MFSAKHGDFAKESRSPRRRCRSVEFAIDGNLWLECILSLYEIRVAESSNLGEMHLEEFRLY
jgi:hypothetical protein